MSTAGERPGIRVVIDERRPSSEAAVAGEAEPVSGRRRTTEPASSRTAAEGPPRLADRPTTDAPPRLADRPTTDAPPRLAERRPARDSVAAPYSFEDFPLRVVRSMHEAARAYRDRVAEEIQLRRVAILTAIRDERRADVVRARAEAVENRRAVERWAVTALRQIKSERERRKVEIEVQLRRTVREKNQQVERRVREVESAIRAHRGEVDAYFDEIDNERDPVAIAQRARTRPPFPALDRLTPAAPAKASPEPAPPVTASEQPTYVQGELFDLDR